MKQVWIRLWTCLICAVMICTMLSTTVSATQIASGTCGNLSWTLDDEGTLTIFGTGAMTSHPWRNQYSEVIKKVVIEKGVTSIVSWGFYGCSNLTSITIPDTVTTIGELAFDRCSSLKNISIPKSVNSIGESAFENCTSLSSVTIPSGVLSIEPYTFNGCSNLVSVTIPNSVIEIGRHAFAGCKKITSISIPKGVLSIGSYAFYGCKSLKSMVVPNGISNIDTCTFYNCENMTSIVLPESLTVIGTFGFSGCSALDDVYFGGSSFQWKELDNRPNAKYIHYGCLEPEGHWKHESKVATCTQDGYERDICGCGYERNGNYTKAFGHDWKAATCTSPKTCKTCGKTSGEALGHSWKAATCTAPKTCKTCGKTKGEKLDHSWIAATCTSPKKCENCDQTSGKKLGHNWSNATCTKAKTCKRCKITTGNALGHDFGEWVTIKKPTTTVKGEAKRVCERENCSYYETKDLGKKPATPELSATSDKASGKPSLKWNKISGAAKYHIYRKTGKDGTYKKIATVTGTKYVDTSAKVAVQYYYRIRAASKTDVTSGYSSSRMRTCDLPKPLVNETNVASSGQVKLTWNQIEGATKYKIYRRVGKSGDYEYYTSTTQTTFTDKNVKAGTVYYYQVKACHKNSNADSAKSAVGQTCDLARPAVTAKLSSGNVKLSWEKVSGTKEYVIYRATSKDGEYKTIATTTSVSFTDKNVKTGKTYYYKVKALHANSNANSAYSSIDSVKVK